MKLWVISTEKVPVEVMGAEAVSPEVADYYLRRAKSLMREKSARFLGRAVEESTGQVYQAFTIEAGEEKARTVFIADQAATRVLSTLLDETGKLRRFNVGTGLGDPASGG